MSRLLKVPMFPDEILSSYVTRLARANGVISTIKFCYDFQISHAGMLNGDAATLRILAKVTGKSEAELDRQAVKLGANKNVTIAGETFEAPAMRRYTIRYCPKCFALDDADTTRMPGTRRYRRGRWLIAALETCAQHSWPLVELSNHDESREDIYEVLQSRKDEMAMKEAATCQRDPSRLDHFISERMAGKRGHGELLDTTPLHIIVAVSRALGVAGLHGPHKLMRDLDEAEIAAATRHGFGAVEGSSAGIFKILDDIVERSPSARGIHSVYGRVTHELRHNAGTPYDRFAALVAEHHGARQPFKRPVKKRPRDARWTTVSEIVNETGLTFPVVRRRLVDAGITVSPDAKIPSEAKALFAGSNKNLIKRKRVAEILGGDTDLVDILREAGLIRRVNLGERIGKAGRLAASDFVEDEVVAFRDKVFGRATSPLKKSMMSIREVSRHHELPKTTVIARLIAGNYPTVATRGTASLLDDILLDPEEVDPKDSNYATLDEAAEMMGVWPKNLRRLVAQGVISIAATRTQEQYSTRTLIAKSEIEKFNDHYISVRSISATTGVNQSSVARLIKAKKIPLAFPADVVRCWIILRSDFVTMLPTAPGGHPGTSRRISV